MESINVQLKHVRKLQGITQLELARACGLKQQQIARFESGGGNIATAEKIAAALGMKLTLQLK